MPELPEVQTTLEGIRPWLMGREIAALKVRDGRLRWPVAATIGRRVVGSRVVAMARRGKYIIIETETGSLIIHLGMSGSLRVVDGDVRVGKHDHFDIRSDQGHIIRYTDPRRFGCLLYTADAPLSHPRLVNLGVEPLSREFSGDYLYRVARQRRRAVKNLLMDGAVVVGVGNIYANEALFLSGIHPLRAGNRISRARYTRLAACVVEVLAQAIAAGGTTLRDFTGADGQPGYFSQTLLVYGRHGQACVNCATPLRRRVIAQRATYYCPGCQT